MLQRWIETLCYCLRTIFPPFYDDEAEVIHNNWDGYTLDDGWAEAQGHMIPAPPEPEPVKQYSDKTAWTAFFDGHMANTTMPNNRRSWLRRVFG